METQHSIVGIVLFLTFADACKNGNYNTAEFLTSIGADSTIRNKDGLTALELATINGFIWSGTYFERKPDANALNETNFPPLLVEDQSIAIPDIEAQIEIGPSTNQQLTEKERKHFIDKQKHELYKQQIEKERLQALKAQQDALELRTKQKQILKQ
jgi:ankyrin repeat protein